MLRISLIAAVVLSLVPLQAARAQPSPAAPADAIVVRGEYLARAGDCVACHSAPGGRAFAGGLPMGTPLGTIVATNITPDIETGIGRYTLADFDAAMRRGIAPGGRHLYPAMPYPSYARLTDEDVAALYAYFTFVWTPIHYIHLMAITLLLSISFGLLVNLVIFRRVARLPDLVRGRKLTDQAATNASAGASPEPGSPQASSGRFPANHD